MKQPVLLPLLFVLMLPLLLLTLHVNHDGEQSSGWYVVSISQTPYLISPIWQEQKRPPRKDYISTHYLVTQSQCHRTHRRHAMEKRSEWSRVSLPQASENYLREERSSLSHSHETTKCDMKWRLGVTLKMLRVAVLHGWEKTAGPQGTQSPEELLKGGGLETFGMAETALQLEHIARKTLVSACPMFWDGPWMDSGCTMFLPSF